MTAPGWTRPALPLVMAAACLAAVACQRAASSLSTSAPSASESAALPPPPVPAATDSAAAAPSAREADAHVIGDKAKLPDYQISVVDVKECKPRSYYKPRQGNIWLGVEISVEATTDKEVRVSPFFARLVDGAGHGHTATFNGCKPELDNSRLGKGEHARGYITFEIPETANGLRLEYDPFVIGGGKQDVSFVVVR